MAIVYVTQEPVGKNITPALEYGSLRVLAPWQVQVQCDPRNIISDMRLELSGARPDDYLLLIGDPVIIGLATALIIEVTGGVIQLLKWDKQEGKYIPITINLSERRVR